MTDPVTPVPVQAQAVDRPRYRFRRLTDVRQALARQPAPIGEQSGLGRFMAEWSLSSAGAQGHFCDHWIVAVREHLDRFRNPMLNATPISRHGRKLKSFHWHPETRGTALSGELHAFDRAAGYPLAWYFHLVAGGLTPHAVVYGIAEDLRADFRYLPEGDMAILEHWLMQPYSV